MPKLPSIKAAKALLETITSAEQAVKLIGPEREAYLKALEAVHGPKEARAAAMGFDLNKPQYHGGVNGLQEFNTKTEKLGPGKLESSVLGSFFTPEKEAAAGYASLADNGSVYEVALKDGKRQRVSYEAHDRLNSLEKAKAMRSQAEADGLAGFEFEDGNGNINETAMLNPSNIRSTSAAFDPRFKDSNKIMAGMAGAGVLGASALGNNEAEAGVTPKLYKIGKEMVEAEHYGHALAKRRELAEAGKVSHTAQIVEHEPVAKNGTVKVVPGLAAMAGVPDINANPMDALRGVGQAWQQHVVDPVAGALQNTLTPDLQMQGQSYPTSSPVSNGIINMAADPVNYVPGGAGAMLGAAQMAAQYADGGVVQKSDEHPMFDSMQADPVEPVQTAAPVGDFDSMVDDSDNTGQKVGAFALGAADSASFGLAGAGLNVLHKIAPETVPSAEDRLKTVEAQPGYHMAGQVAGLFAPGGAGSLMTKAGEAVASKLAAKTVMGRIGSAAARGAVENVIFAGGDETAKMFMNDPHQTAESAITNLGLSAVIGGALGGAVGGVGELWDMGPGKKLVGVLNGLKARAAGLTPKEAQLAGLELPPEIVASLEPGFAKEQGVALQQSDSLAGRSFQKNLDHTYTKIETSVNDTLGKTTADIEKLGELSDHAAGTGMRQTLQKEISDTYEPIRKGYKDAESKLKEAPIAPETQASVATDITDYIAKEGLAKAVDGASLDLAQKTLSKLAQQESAHDLRLMAQNLAKSHPYGKDTYQTAKDLVAIIKRAQDVTTGAAADRIGPEFANNFKALQARYRQYKGVLDDVASYAGIGRVGGTENFSKKLAEKLDGADVARRFSKDSVEMRQLLEQNFPATAARARQHELDTLLAKSRTKAGDAIDITKLEKNLAKLDPESQAQMLNSEQLGQLSKLHDVASKLPKNDNYSGTAKAISRTWGYLPAAAGGMAGMLTGDDHNALMGILAGAAAHQAGPALRLAALKFLASDAPVSARGFKAVIDMAKNAAKGEKRMDQAAEAVFSKAKNGTAEVDAKAIEKLKAQVDAVSAEPKLLLAMGSHLDHYMPEVATASAETASRNIMYLASLRPQTAPLSPLDGIRKVSKQEDSEYERALQIAENPLVVLDHVRNGRLDPKDLQHLQTMNPKAYERMQAKVSEQMAKHLADSGTVPYKTQMGLSVFLRQPMSSSMQPQAIMAAQPKPQQARMPNATSMQGLQKMPGMFQTPQQARQSRKLK